MGIKLTKTVSIGYFKVNGFIYGKIFKKSIYIYFGWNLQEFKISFNITQKSINFKQKKYSTWMKCMLDLLKNDLESDWNLNRPKILFQTKGCKYPQRMAQTFFTVDFIRYD